MGDFIDKPVTDEPELEIIINDPGSSFRWNRHNYSSHLAKWNYHPEYELHLITRSTGTLFVGDCIEAFEPGNLCLIGPNVPHNWTSNQRDNEKVVGRDVVIQFTKQSIGLEAKTCPQEMDELKKLLDMSKLGLVFEGPKTEYVGQLMIDVGKKKGLAAFSGFLNIMSILANEVESRALATPLYRPNLNQQTTVWLQMVFEEVSENLHEEIKLSYFAEKLGMTESTFSRFFSRNSGMNFSSYVRVLRIGRACSLLHDTDDKIVDIGVDSGFQNLSNFNRHFKAQVGMTPNQYRNLSKQRAFKQ